MSKRRYMIYGPIWNHRSGGLVALYNLQKELILLGFDCIYYSQGSESIAQTEVNDYDVVIYPEIIIGNPLGAKNVVRWLLNVPGVCGGDGIFDDHDLIFSYHHTFHWPKLDGYLFINNIEGDLTDFGLPRTHDCIWYYKSKSNRIQLNGIEITSQWPETKRELIDLLQRCKTFYSYDTVSCLPLEAKLCGCEVKQINGDGSIQDYILPIDYQESVKQASSQLERFIVLTQSEEW